MSPAVAWCTDKLFAAKDRIEDWADSILYKHHIRRLRKHVFAMDRIAMQYDCGISMVSLISKAFVRHALAKDRHLNWLRAYEQRKGVPDEPG